MLSELFVDVPQSSRPTAGPEKSSVTPKYLAPKKKKTKWPRLLDRYALFERSEYQGPRLKITLFIGMCGGKVALWPGVDVGSYSEAVVLLPEGEWH